jgi:phosphotransferase system enzyme I (PtsP)
MVADHMNAGVCSIYIYDEPGKKLVLKANKGLNPSAVNGISMDLGEGLVGIAMKEARVINEKIGKNHPGFKFYPGSGEEDYSAFLAVPIMRGIVKIGVLVVQRGEGSHFDDRDIIAMRATASQLATVLEHIKLLMSSAPPLETKKTEAAEGEFRFLKGISASQGSVLAPVMHRGQEELPDLPSPEINDMAFTPDDFEKALKKTEKHLETLQERVEEKLSDAASLIFASHLLMLKDRGFTGGMRELIRSGEKAPAAILKIFTKYRNLFAGSANPLTRRSSDLSGKRPRT